MQLILGDCLEVMKELPDNSIDLVLTDPPYLMKYRSDWRKYKYDFIKNDDNEDWIPLLFETINRVVKNNSSILLFCSKETIPLFLEYGGKYFNTKNMLVWVKNNQTAGDLYCDFGNKVEYILHFQKGRNKLRGKRDSNVLFYNKTANKFHPTEKPVDLLEYLIEKLSDEGNLVLDCFAGSGTTGIACVNTNRDFIGIEKDEKYFEIAKKRIEGLGA